ncbi:MAG TPA: sodium:proton antiporter [Alphaproteobacteria bacterium]|nr:sodium:proton antiporter [Alphaproteobacteria bacterium]
MLLTLAAGGAYINYRFLKLPATIGLMALALMMSLGAIGLNKLGVIDLSGASIFLAQINFPALLLHGILAFLLFAGALHIDLSEMKKQQTLILILATVGVVISTFVTGSLVWYALGLIGFTLPYIFALLFGALISPTDPVAVLGILKSTKMSAVLRTKIASESLLNDGVGVVLFLVLLTIADPNVPNLTAEQILLLFLWEGSGSIILGMTLGWLTHRLLRQLDDYKVGVLLTLALVTGGYTLAEIIHVSAPITIVAAGLVIGNHGQMFGVSDRTRRHLDMFWELLDEILNAVLFILIGLQIMVISLKISYLALGLVAVVATLIGRYVSVALPVMLMNFKSKFERGTIRLLTWGGLRGGISIALALSLPAGPEKDVLLTMTYVTVLFSVLLQGTTFRYVAGSMIKKS